MSIAIWYWLILFLWVVLWGGLYYRPEVYPGWVPNVLLLLLFVLIGLGEFGSPVR